MLLRTVISVSQLSIYGFWKKVQNCKKNPRVSSILCGSGSSGTLYAKEIFEMTRFYRDSVMLENARCSPGGNRTISGSDTSTTSTASTTISAIRRRRKLRLQCRSKDWMAVLQRAMEKPASSIFIFNFAVADFAMANELELMATYIILSEKCSTSQT